MSSSCESILDHIADHLKFISKAQSFWFTLNTSYDHGCHLASRFLLEPNEYEGGGSTATAAAERQRRWQRGGGGGSTVAASAEWRR